MSQSVQPMMSFDSSISMGSVPISIKKPRKLVVINDDKKPVTTMETGVSTKEIIEKIVVDEKAVEDVKKEIEKNICDNGKEVLSHLGEYIEEPYQLIESYFQGQHLERLVRHQIESYNHFINYQIQRTINMFNPVVIRSENDYVEERGQYFLEANVSFENFKLYPPQIHENNGATKMMLPQEAKLRNFTYASGMTVDVKIKYIVRNTENMDTPKIIEKTLPKINIGKMPIMVKSSICVLTQNKHLQPSFTGECKMDCGGYFIIKGSEKTVLGQERAAENRVYCFDGKNTTKWNWFAEIKSIPDYKCISPKQIEMMIASKNNGFGNGIYVTVPRIKQPIELFVLFRALGIISDKEICQYILLDIEEEKNGDLLKCLQASIIDANKYLTQEDAIRHITSFVAYTPFNMDRESGLLKKREFALEVLNNDLFPHCQTMTQKIYMLGHMCKKLIQTSLGWIPCDDRDSYLNKRIELTGTLLNNLFRNYFNKLVKEMQKQVVREINNGSWRSTEDYENIINMTNIYKIMKSTTIENGITRALSTGDFSIKQANSSKVGVAQVLNRLTYVASLSHLRRINTPLEKSGELIAPRKLHNTTFGFLCPAETPEGQSIGIVKNISYMGHITIPTNSSSLYEYVKPYVQPVDNTLPSELYNKVKVFINGCWVGVSENPIELYNEMKNKKYKGIINIYTSIVFDYKLMEIRICNDGGRLTRPVLRVRDNKALLDHRIIEKLKNKEITWNDLLTSCKIEESIIEYIDPEEQNYSLIAMKAKHGYIQDGQQKISYSHCEIHPSTIFGVLASCIPFPEHNQAPRNTYQSAMAKQAIGVYATNYDHRMDKTAYVLSYPSRPLVETRLMNFIHLNQIPSGCQIHVAIMTHTGYNQEDSVLVNKGSIDRGLFMATIYHTEKDEDKNIIRDEIIRCKPDKTKTKGIKFGNYDKLNNQGFIPENSLVENRDVIIAKIIPIKENRNDPTKVIKYEDQSKTFRTTEETYIDKNFTGRNGDGYNFAKVRVRILRKPTYGDKFCALPSQQVLTDHGWMQICDIDITKHKVCSIGTDGNMIYEYPTAKFEYDHNDKMYSIKNKQIEIVCTLNHRLYVQKRNGKNYELIEAKDVMGKMVRFQKSLENAYPDVPTIRIGDVDYDMDAWLQFVGMFISDGHADFNNKCMYITALKERKIEFNTSIFEKLGIQYSYHTDGKYYISGSKYPDVYEELKKISPGALNKYLPEYVWNLSKRQSIVLLEALLQGDGTTIKYKGEDEFSRYGTISIRLANDISRLAVHCGWSGIIKIAEEPTGIARTGKRNLGSRAGTEVSITQKHTYYKVSIIRKQNQPWINKKKNESNKEELVDYNGKVYCIEMPSSHTYYMRETENSPSLIIGNSSRHGQKGTCGNIIPECDMPFTKDGLRPDIIINPHAIPSRMTIAQLKETLLGKVLLELGLFGDGTSFGDLDVKTIIQELQKLGYESYGNEVMYNGLTGEQLETSIFIGPVFYQRLKHMVSDKQHSRAIGPMVNLTRQPAEGRSRDGGFRIGEMERDIMIAHGMSKFCKERLYDVSDKYSVHVCKKCGMIASYNDGNKNSKYANADFSIHHCNTCNNMTDFAKVNIPYAYKLLSQELQTINIVPRIITE
uniref:DNA-directed RNA polymerase n=1 Tax=viral metagenome TaxID=1070528 RepID=A0A6C0ER99_9ZZZZ